MRSAILKYICSAIGHSYSDMILNVSQRVGDDGEFVCFSIDSECKFCKQESRIFEHEYELQHSAPIEWIELENQNVNPKTNE